MSLRYTFGSSFSWISRGAGGPQLPLALHCCSSACSRSRSISRKISASSSERAITSFISSSSMTSVSFASFSSGSLASNALWNQQVVNRSEANSQYDDQGKQRNEPHRRGIPYQQRVPVLSRRLVVELPSLDDLPVDVKFILRPREDVLLNGLLSDKPEDADLFGLADAVLVRIPVRVENNDRVGGLEVEPKAPGARGQEEDGDVRLWVIELPEQLRPVVGLDRAVQAKVFVTAEMQEVFHDGHDRCHLEKNQHAVAGPEKLGEYPVQQLEFAGHSVQLLVVHVCRVDQPLHIFEDVRVVADLPQLHDRVVQTFYA
ncbi:MAG: hypothetical protein BJ554DRAFT_1686 [Olpidium bornovanus]|uniref:Uncharacterized protein n=1 Tax=Olpidium bornovanus TaxID=278681 RepID=A0A8H8DHA0_9FUNG|nr:MAG: hypothetical protein BJ554DRAFT_1686 [Olpidium bornovanus]